MSDIQSISQNNYILHNIDAKKLYVQEPLFTANSGDAVYVGWRPDETVLWSGTGTNPVYVSGTFNENPWNFSSLKFYQCNLHGGKCVSEIELYDNPTSADKSVVIMSPRGNNEINFDAVKLILNPTTWSATNSKTLQMSWTTTAFNNNANVSAALNSVIKICGVNRISGGNV